MGPLLYPNVESPSRYEISFSRRPAGDPDKNRAPVQRKTTVRAERYDELDLDIPTLIAMDTEGSKLCVLPGFGGSLREVRVAIFETSF